MTFHGDAHDQTSVAGVQVESKLGMQHVPTYSFYLCTTEMWPSYVKSMTLMKHSH